MSAALDLSRHPQFVANDNAALSAAPKVNRRIAAQQPIDSQDRLSRRVYDAAGNMTYMYNATDKEYMEYRRAAGMLYARAGTATDAAGDNEGGHLHLDHLGSPVAKTAPQA